jgi:heat shock protein HslJ
MMMRQPGWSRAFSIALTVTLACAGPRTPQGPMPTGLTGINWRLISLAGRSPAASATGVDPSLTLTTNNGVTGYSGCSQFSGSYTLQGDTLRFGTLTNSGTGCAGNMSLERNYLAALGATDRFQVSPDSLILFQRGAPGLVYKR